MQPDKSEKKMDLSCRSLLAGVIATTDKDDCLHQFVQLRGLRVLDEWLQEAHKGKIGDSSSPRDQDRSVEDLILVLLRALDRLPVNLNALQMCNIGKSVNHLRSHRNSEIQKKARSLVDTWKKRVEAEMNINDSKSGTSHAVSWPARTRNEASQVGNRHPSGSSDATMKNSISQLSSSKSAPVKLVQGDAIAKSPSASASPGAVKLASSPASTSASLRDGHLRTSFVSGSSELPQSAARDEKSSGSSQSHTNSQCSSDHAKNTGPSVKEDSRSSNSGSTSLNKSSGSASRHRKSANGLQGLAVSAVQKDGGSSRNSSVTRVSVSEKLPQQPVTCEKAMDALVSDSTNHKLIVKISNRGRSPAQSNGGSVEDPTSTNSRASSPVLPEKHGQLDHSSKEKSDGFRNNAPSDVNTESWQSNDLKDGMTGGEEGDGSPATGPDSGRPITDEAGKPTDVAKVMSSIKSEIKTRKSLDSSLSSINALIESCAKCSEDNTPISVGDDGMNLLASVAAGEISKSGGVSPAQSPQRSTSLADESCKDYSNRSKPNGDVYASIGDKNRPSAAAVAETQKQNVSPGDSSVHHEDSGDRSRISGKDMLNNVEACSKSDKKTDEVGVTISASLLATCAVSNEGAEQALESKTGVKDNSNVRTPNRREGVSSCSATEDKVNDVSLKERIRIRPAETAPAPSADVDEKADVKSCPKGATVSPPASVASTTGRSMGELGAETMNGKIVAAKEESQNEQPVASQGHGVGLEVKDKVKGSSLNVEFEKKAHKDAALCPPNDDDKKQVSQGLRSNIVLEQKSHAVAVKVDSAITNEKPVMVSNDVKSEKAEGVAVCGLASQSGKRILDKESDSSVPEKEGEHELCGADVDLGRSCKDQNSENKDATAQQCDISGAQVSCTAIALSEAELHSNAERAKVTKMDEERKERSVSATDNVSLPPASRGPDVDTKLGFDLNKGFNVDEGRNGEPVNLGSGPCPDIVCSVSPLQIPVCSASCGLPASITVAAAAKGPFVPPDDLLWNKRELGWKGSAATSAFRPAEPRKSLLPDSPAPRPARIPLDIDLNVADESGGQEFYVRNNPVCELMTTASLRSSGGLDLDLNKVDETSDMTHVGRHMTSNTQRFEVSTQHVKASTSNVYSNGGGSGKRDFDLNDGPAAEELPVEPIPSRQLNSGYIPLQSPFAPRINSSDTGNCFSWYPPGTSYSVSMTPSALPDREAFSLVGIGGGPQRVVGGPTTALSFNPDAYNGSVLSSSPALPFHPAPFQYPVLPLGTSFPLPTSALAGGSSGYMDPTAGGRISAIPSQLVGNAAAVSFQYPHAYVVSRPIPDTGNNSVIGGNHIWGKQGLDLNSGPGVLDVEGRDESLPIVSRQVSTISSQSLADEQARMYSMGGGHMKRKEPEGGWNIDKLNFKQPSWR
uniref:TFIIS N-terminal domain-containing protein n=1 Tax=Chenopodium quinoa TaxID=63459 RepID=A0A803L8S6_CHEQI